MLSLIRLTQELKHSKIEQDGLLKILPHKLKLGEKQTCDMSKGCREVTPQKLYSLIKKRICYSR